ncbi:PREDICTED: gamma-glutamylcyclotransferase isoform X3 [Galeopterus variegatus]|uniref:gamma-glutamylcyclotransferase n=1 Tax=Galeopterus variegatus TaxID=482537 RepID=A0ABM0RFJ8_GALVR|nr:PREDICTED: gamma-glutamylcyclotransferase isoform X3 [Galeopterus variegatus]
MANSGCEDGPGQEEESFLYFAYGSNLLTERIRLRNPSAAFCCVARLRLLTHRRNSKFIECFNCMEFKDFKLDFGNSQGKTSQTWHGGKKGLKVELMS